jgi:hypothetical protein
MTEDKFEELFDELLRMLLPAREPVPAHFHRSFEGRPFEACDFCGKARLEPAASYTVNKYFAQGTLRQEIATSAFRPAAMSWNQRSW